MKRISIKKEFSEDYITRAAGERLREMILDAHREGDGVEIDFTGLKIGSTSFFDEAFAKLSDHGWSRAMFVERVKLQELHALDRKVLESVLRYRGMK